MPDDADPRPTPTTPEAILAATDLDREQKIARLRELAYDARELDVAKDEGMGGGEQLDLSRIVRALRQLGVEDTETDHKQ